MTGHQDEGDADGPVPVVLGDTGELTRGTPRARGAAWRLAEPGRQMDANVVRLPPGERIDTHTEPDLDVLLVVLAGGRHGRVPPTAASRWPRARSSGSPGAPPAASPPVRPACRG